jgi:hypothetical protein
MVLSEVGGRRMDSRVEVENRVEWLRGQGMDSRVEVRDSVEWLRVL